MPHSAQYTAAMAGFGLVFMLIGLLGIIFAIVIYWRIAVKAGYSGALSLLMLVPLVNLVVVALFAFTEWPIEQRLKAVAAGAPLTTI